MEGLIPIFGILTGLGITVACIWGLVRISQGQIGEAIARWIGSQGGQFGNPELAAQVTALQEQVEQMQQQLVEAHERIDFAERLLARPRSETGVRE